MRSITKLSLHPSDASAFKRGLRRHIPTLAAIGLFTFLVNMLGLTGSLFMLQVYDRVLPSRSEPTLIALLIVVAGLYGSMGMLDSLRSRIGARVGAVLQTDLDEPVLRATLDPIGSATEGSVTGLLDLEALRKFLGSPLAFAMLDLPFSPFFFFLIFLFHPYLGWLAVCGGVLLVLVMFANQLAGRGYGNAGAHMSASAARLAEQIRLQSDTVRSLGMVGNAAARWQQFRQGALVAEMHLSDQSARFGSAVKSFRLFLQSAMLALAAWLVMREEMSSGGMIASSILTSRALQPIEQLVGGWSQVARARRAWVSLKHQLRTTGQQSRVTKLNVPAARLAVTDLTVVPPGERKPVLSRVSFSLEAGQALGVIGESASGKSTLARTLVGLWKPTAGEVRLGGATLDQFGSDLARYVGYVPQDVVLFDGTISENIARLEPKPRDEEVIHAAESAGAHEMILNLPNGYDSGVGPTGAKLSGGQKQRVALARALYRDPVMVVLDEPNSNLDGRGSNALNQAIRQLKASGRLVVVMAHRPAALAECDLIMVLRNGCVAALGTREEVIKSNTIVQPRSALSPMSIGG